MPFSITGLKRCKKCNMKIQHIFISDLIDLITFKAYLGTNHICDKNDILNNKLRKLIKNFSI